MIQLSFIEGLFSAGIVLGTRHTIRPSPSPRTLQFSNGAGEVNEQLHCGYAELGKLLDLPKPQFS